MARLASGPYRDDRRVFSAAGTRDLGECFPIRFKLSPIKELVEPVVLADLVPEMMLFSNKKRWGLHLRGSSMVQLPEEDYLLVMRAAGFGLPLKAGRSGKLDS